MCELEGTYILSQLNTVFENENFGLYRDDGLGTFRNLSGPEIKRKRKANVCVFKECGLSITTKANLKVVNFLDKYSIRFNKWHLLTTQKNLMTI